MPLSRRERQIMDILFRRERATIAEILADLPDPPTDSAVRSALRLLEQKNRVQHVQVGAQNVYQPTTPVTQARNSALKHLLDTFFRGSRERALAAMLEMDDLDLSERELERVAELIEAKRKRKGTL